MKLKLDLKNGIPIYIQLKNGIKYAIASGQLAPGNQLPTVRQLAVDLKVNVNTISRVYSELEREGILSTKQGKGSFVNANESASHDRKQEHLERLVDRLIIEAFELGYRPAELLACLKRRIPNKETGQD